MLIDTKDAKQAATDVLLSSICDARAAAVLGLSTLTPSSAPRRRTGRSPRPRPDARSQAPWLE